MLPNKMKVAGIDYEVSQIDGLALEHNLCGQVLYEYRKIKIDSGMCEQKKEQTLVHEVLHAIFNEAGYNEQDEDVINRISIVLYQVMKDNDFNFLEADTAER